MSKVNFRKVSEKGVLEQIFNSTNFNYLPRAMVAANMRQEVIANNIANVNTPNYRKSVVEFEDLLAREIYGEEPDGKLKMVRTHDRQLLKTTRQLCAWTITTSILILKWRNCRKLNSTTTHL